MRVIAHHNGWGEAPQPKREDQKQSRGQRGSGTFSGWQPMLTLLSEQMLDACNCQNIICHYWLVVGGLRLVLISDKYQNKL